MSTEKIIDSLFDNNLEQFRNEVRAALFVKTGEYMQNAKQEIASSMMNSQDVQEQDIKGGQIKLAEAYPYPEGEVEDSCFEKCHQENVYGKGGNEYHDAFNDCVKRCKKRG